MDEPQVVGDAGMGQDFDPFYRQHRRRVVALAYGLSGSASAAEELAQDAFLAALRRWDSIGAYEDPGAWVRRVVVNRSVSGVRRRVAEARALIRFANRPAPPAALDPVDAEFWSAVRRLPARQAQVIALHYVDDRAIDDIAALLGIAPGTVKATLFQARKSLAATLGCEIEEEDA
jgi:RNA polymerase sigma-70 factor (ECF subfamily)